jgi:hypothetical protein
VDEASRVIKVLRKKRDLVIIFELTDTRVFALIADAWWQDLRKFVATLVTEPNPFAIIKLAYWAIHPLSRP